MSSRRLHRVLVIWGGMFFVFFHSSVLFGEKGDGAELEFKQENGLSVVIGWIEIPVSQEIIWAVLTDYDNFETFIPNMTESRILKKEKNGQIHLEQVTVQGFLFFKKRLRIVLDVVEVPFKRVAFSLIEGDFETYRGDWEIDIQQTPIRVYFHLWMRPDFFAPRFLLRRILRNSGQQALEAVRNEALRRWERH
jgi:ribosome-associated toxin RatA of RatAB toxin-antitoxin module